MNTLTKSAERLLRKWHRDQSGAIALLSLAGLLIILMTTMMMWDAGKGARDKIEVQKGADAAALSQAVVKSRSMNMIAYSNITKRILYGYNTIYVAAFLALVEASAYYLGVAATKAAKAVKGIPLCVTVVGCIVPVRNAYQAIVNAIEGIKGVIQLVLEVVEFTMVNGGRLYGFPGGGGDEVGRSIREVAALDYYQAYMKSIAPWWGWGEAVTRGMRNGATLIGTTPIPEGDGTRLRAKVRFGLNAINGIFGGGVPAPDNLFRMTNDSDSLPIEQVPDLATLGPLATIGVPKFVSHAKMCGGTLTSPEFWLMQYYFDHWRSGKSEGYWRDTSKPSGASFAPQRLVTILEIANMPVGCVVSALTLGHKVLPYEIKVSVSSSPLAVFSDSTPDPWLKATQNVVVGYKHGKDRNSDTGGRKKLQFMEKDYSLGVRKVLFSNEGYWTIAKSEMVFDRGIVGGLAANMSGINSIPLAGKIFGFIANLLNEPNMWEPQWTGRLRPLALPNESEALSDLDRIYHDALAFMIPLAPLAYMYGEGDSFPSLDSMTNLSGQLGSGLNYLTGMANDAYYMERAVDPYTVDKQHVGFEK